MSRRTASAVRRRGALELRRQRPLGDGEGLPASRSATSSATGRAASATGSYHDSYRRRKIHASSGKADVGRRDAATLVVAEPEPAQLAPHVRDVRACRDLRVLTGVHGIALGGKAERVVAAAISMPSRLGAQRVGTASIRWNSFRSSLSSAREKPR
jgi:hypothetical protein